MVSSRRRKKKKKEMILPILWFSVFVVCSASPCLSLSAAVVCCCCCSCWDDEKGITFKGSLGLMVERRELFMLWFWVWGFGGCMAIRKGGFGSLERKYLWEGISHSSKSENVQVLNLMSPCFYIYSNRGAKTENRKLTNSLI